MEVNLKLSLKELKRISRWFDSAGDNLENFDLKIYEKINEFIKEQEQLNSTDILTYRPIKKKKDFYDDDAEFKRYTSEDYDD